MEGHIKKLEQVCRISGGKFTKQDRSTRYSVAERAGEIQACFKINVLNDQPGIHPEFFCRTCKKVLDRYSKASSSFVTRGGGCGSSSIEWVAHKRTGCSVCDTLSRPGRAATKDTTPRLIDKCDDASECPQATQDQTVNPQSSHEKQAGTQTSTDVDVDIEDQSGVDVDITEVQKKATPPYQAGIALDGSRFTHDVSYAACPICRLVTDPAIEAPCCKQVFCLPCIYQWLQGSTKCPYCRSALMASQLTSPHPFVGHALAAMLVHCDFRESPLVGCRQVLSLASLVDHVRECSHNPGNSLEPHPTVVTGSFSVSDVLLTTPQHTRGATSTALLSHLVGCMSVGGTLEVWSGSRGRPQTWKRVTKGEKEASDVTTRTLERRGSELKSLATTVASSSGSAQEQLQHDLKVMAKSDRDSLLTDAGLLCTGEVSALALKADLHLTWYALRKLRVWLTEFGIFLQSERLMRADIRSELPFEFLAEKVPMTDKAGNITLCAMVAILDLVGLVTHYLSAMHEAGQLTWHDGAVPKDTIIVKIGGDHGGKSFKMAFQIANHVHPNALENTVPFLLFAAKDSPANMATALQPFQAQIRELSTMTFMSYKVKVVLFGDYEFQTHNYGLSGSSGVFPCLHCHTAKRDFQQSPAARTQPVLPRTLTTLAQNHKEFLESGGVASNAKKYFNAVRPCILPVPIEDACIPSLHLDLGIFPYLFECMLQETQSLDVALANHMPDINCDLNGRTFNDLVKMNSDRKSKELELATIDTKLDDMMQLLTFNAIHLQQAAGTEVQRIQVVIGQLQLQHRQLSEQQKQIKAELDVLKGHIDSVKTLTDGPCLSSYDDTLQTVNIKRQQYHGGTFVGNHVHRMLSPDKDGNFALVHKLVQAPSKALEKYELGADHPVTDMAASLAARYTALFTTFAKCRAVYNLASAVNEDQLHQLQCHIQSFMTLVREQIVKRHLGNITPKLHLLEQHVVPQMTHFGCGLSLLCEQGGEALHAAFNTLDKKCSAACPLQRLLSITRQHYLRTIPKLQNEMPSAKRRKDRRVRSNINSNHCKEK
eukprot:scpid26705/ scgid6721/ E3 ubiquitin-protein ligase NRDP1; RING finger protein 41